MIAVLFAVVVLALAALAVVVVAHRRQLARESDEQVAALRREIDVLSTLASLHDAALERQSCAIEALAANVRSQASSHDMRFAALTEQIEGRPASRRRPVVVEVLSADGRRIG